MLEGLSLGKRGRSLAWSRIPAWGAGDPGFKSQRPHHNNLGPIFRLLTLAEELNFVKVADIFKACFYELLGFFDALCNCGMELVAFKVDKLSVQSVF